MTLVKNSLKCEIIFGNYTFAAVTYDPYRQFSSKSAPSFRQATADATKAIEDASENKAWQK